MNPVNPRLHANVLKLNAAKDPHLPQFIYRDPPASGTFPMGHKKLDNVRRGTLCDGYALARDPLTVGQFRPGAEWLQAQAAEGGISRFALQARRAGKLVIADTTNESHLGRVLIAYAERAGERALEGAEFTLIANPALASAGRLVMPALDAAFAGAQHPMVMISRADVALWLDHYLTPKIQQITGDVTLRAVLPSEEIWEHAATCGGKFDYATQTGKLKSRSTGAKLAHYEEESTAPVGTYPANPWGFRGMTGNIWEMTDSLYQLTDSSVFCDRGGSWRSRILLAADRGGSRSDNCGNNLGCRVGLAQDSA